MIKLKFIDKTVSINEFKFKIIESNFSSFFTNLMHNDLQINLKICENLENTNRINISSDSFYLNQIYEDERAYVKIVKSKERKEIIAHCYYLKNENIIEVYCLEKYKDYFNSLEYCITTIGFENIIGYLNGLIVHSSFVDYHDNGFLFVGNSGIGKSTRAKLWENEGAKIINGDRTILSYFEKWNGYGSPYAGSSKININDKCEVKAIFIINRAGDNEILMEKVSYSNAVKEIYKNSTIPLWNKKQVNQSLDLIQQMVTNIPVYRITCPPDQRLIHLIKKEMGLLNG